MDHFNWFPVVTAGLSALLWFLYSRDDKAIKVPYLNEIAFEPVFRITRPRTNKKDQVVETSAQKKEPEVESWAVPVPDTRKLVFSVLNDLKLDYKLDSEGDILFRYHGEHFIISARDDSQYISIRYLYWYDAPLDDIDNLSNVHKAVNECNICGCNTIVYTYMKDENTVNLHILRTVLLIPEIPAIGLYFKFELDDMMNSQQHFYKTMEKIRREQYNANK